jgi:hypothetical protein
MAAFDGEKDRPVRHRLFRVPADHRVAPPDQRDSIADIGHWGLPPSLPFEIGPDTHAPLLERIGKHHLDDLQPLRQSFARELTYMLHAKGPNWPPTIEPVCFWMADRL